MRLQVDDGRTVRNVAWASPRPRIIIAVRQALSEWPSRWQSAVAIQPRGDVLAGKQRSIGAAVPELHTPRALLRPLTTSDFDAYVEIWADPVVTRFIGGRPFTREESWVRFLRHAGHWAVLGYGFWAIEDRASGRLIGEAGFQDLKRAIVPSLEGSPEAGWGFLPEAHGRGLASEVVAAILAWRDAHIAPGRTVAIIDPAHAASIRVAEKNGFRMLTQADYRGPTLVMER